MLTRFLVLLPVWFFGTLVLPWLLVPIAVSRMKMATGRLTFFRWLETHDNLGWPGPASEEATAQFGRTRKAMRRWLLRNKAYALRYKMGVPFIHEDVNWGLLRTKGREDPPIWGLSYYYVEIEANGKRYFELQPSLCLGPNFRLYARIGWKVKRLGTGSPKGGTGIYTGITPRTDNRDD